MMLKRITLLLLAVFLFQSADAQRLKGLYKKARAGEIKNFTGVDAPFEVPENPNIRVETVDHSPEHIVGVLLDYILPKLYY